MWTDELLRSLAFRVNRDSSMGFVCLLLLVYLIKACGNMLAAISSRMLSTSEPVEEIVLHSSWIYQVAISKWCNDHALSSTFSTSNRLTIFSDILKSLTSPILCP